jgi:hypothetical protein
MKVVKFNQLNKLISQIHIINPQNVPYEILSLHTREGMTLAYLLAESPFTQVDAPFMDDLLQDNALSLTNSTFDDTVAGVLARRGWLGGEQTFAVLSLPAGKDGSAAHVMAKNKHHFTQIPVLSLMNEYGDSVAHIEAQNGQKFPLLDNFSKSSRATVLALRNSKNGRLVMHDMAACGVIFSGEDLAMADGKGWCVAHEMAEQGYCFYNEDVLNYQDHKDNTVRAIYEKGRYARGNKTDNAKRNYLGLIDDLGMLSHLPRDTLSLSMMGLDPIADNRSANA